ncbi:glycoside hydrolase family protein [Paenibacillus alba]|uniref:RHS repeat-associated core domain-containing protein n=1 Tax=Paenibacillus alba TaxID=1197127 RepID=UPI001562FF34|nr:RHS repeat-associated core domain-containing protein [Paenibacillus alba]NQX67316.1 glycoside hydrolase family protein [Paenibacillus alba]
MNKLLKRVFSITLLFTLLISNLPIASTVSYAETSDKQEKKQNDATEKRKKKMKDSFSVSSDDIQGILDQGYTLDDAENALQDQKESNGEIKASLDKVKPSFVNKSKEAKSQIDSSLGEKSYETMVTTAADTSDPVPDYSYVNTHPDEAPYSIKLDQETVSTLSGGLSMQASDMSLPGRNGLGFTLTRSYDSGSSQLNQMVAYGNTNGTVKPNDEKLFPIGKGWTWNISYIEISGSNKFLHLGGSGVYKIDASNNLVGYAWKDLTFTSDTTVSVNGIASAYVVKSLQNVKQHFSVSGQLLQISDAYNNKVTFTYENNATYGSVLKTITDAIGNTILISYGSASVILTKGTQTVTYYKTTQNGKELLNQVVDAVGRATTYDYDLKDALFSLTGTTPNTSNPYALLVGVTHPTGSKSVYKYEDTATKRFTGTNSVNQVFRVKSREEVFTKTDNSMETVNHKDITYPLSDIGSSYNPTTPLEFSVAVDNGLTKTTFTNKKVYFNEDTPSVFYNTKVVTTSQYGGKTYTNTTDYTYDEARKWTSPITTTVAKTETGATVPATMTTSQSYNDYGSVTSAVDVLNNTTTYTYDTASFLLVGVTRPVSNSQTQYTEYVRDPIHGNVTTVRVHEGNLTGTVLQETINDTYDSYGNALQTKVKKNATDYVTFQTEYNAAAPYNGAFPTKQTIAVKDANGASSTMIKQYEYNTASGQLKTFIDGKTQSTTYEYDAIGRVTKAIHPDNSFVKVDYFDFQNQVQQTDETGIQTLTKWNPLGWKVDAGINDRGIYKSKTKYSYDKYGRMEATEDALGNKTSYGYDQWSRQNLITYPGGSSASVLYDDTSVINTKTSTDAEGYVIKEYYDKGGRTTSKEETKKIAGGGTKTTTLGTFAFDNVGHVLTATDNQVPQNTTTYNYDTIGRLTRVLNAKNEPTSYQYDNLGNLLQVTYPDGKTNLKKYDEIGRLIQTTDANSKVEKFFYDANSNQTGLIDRNLNYFKYTFDNRNFLKSKEITDASWNPIASEEKIGFRYDLAGRRTEMVDGTGTTGYNFSLSTGALSTQTYPDGKTIKYDYDAAGNRFVMNDPFGVNTYYHYDSRNRLDIVAPSADFLNNSTTTDYDAKYTYYNNSLLKQITQRNGVTSDFSYDGLRIGSLTEKKSNGTPLNTFTYTYDNNGNQKTRTEKIGNDPEVPANTNNFSYDPLNRISTSDQFNETYGYDNRGNRTSMTTSNPFDSPDVTRTFDKRDRLTNVALTSGGNVAYKYNGDGLLWERTENGQKTRYYWDGDQVIAEANVVGGVATLKARYIRGQGLVAREDGQGKAYYLQNGHGDVVNMMDSTGTTKLNSYSYDVFGNTVSRQENLPQPFKYSGEMMDDKVGLQYLRARWYDPSMGRFVQEDTYAGQIDNPLSQNRFTYVSNNPIFYKDPTGHKFECEGCSSEENKKADDNYYERRNNNPSQVSDKLVYFVANYEQFYGKPYRGQDSKNLTIGYGHVIKKGENFGSGITKEEALELLLKDLQSRVETVADWAAKNDVKLNQQQFDALVSFVFNAGEGMLINEDQDVGIIIKSGDYPSDKLKEAFLDVVKVTTDEGKIKSAGLYRRRMDEWQIFMSGEYNRDYPKAPSGYK